MLIKSAWIGLLFLVVFPLSTIWAQDMRHGQWWHDNSIVQEMQLTESERNELDKNYIESRRKMIDLKSEIEKQRFELDLLLGTRDADKQKIMSRFASLEQARAELSRVRFEMLMEIRETIGAERYQELKVMYRERDRKDTKRFRKDGSYSRGRDRD